MRQSQRLVINASSVIVKTLVLMAIGVILPPFVILRIGRANYGFVILISSFLGFLQMVQMGTPQALNRFIPSELERGDWKSLCSLMSTGFAMLCCCGAVVAGVVVVAVYHPHWLVKIPDGVAPETIQHLIIIMGVAAAIDMPLSFGHVAFQAHERYVIHSVLQTLGYISRLVLILLLLTAFPGNLLAYAYGTVGGNFLQSLGIFVVGLFLFRETRLSVRAISFGTMMKIARFGLLTLLNTMAMMMFVQADYIVIGKMIGNEEVTAFNLGVVWVLIVRTYVNAALSVVTPSAARTEAARRPEILREMLLRTTKYGLLASLLPLLFLIPFRYSLMEVWMGPDYSLSAHILLFILVGDIFANGVSGGISMLIGVGRLRFLTGANMIAGVLNIGLGVFLLRIFGLGVMSFAYAYCLVLAILNGVVLPVYLSQTFRLPLREYLRKAWLRPALAGIIALPIAFFIHQVVQPIGWRGIVLCATLFLIGYSIVIFGVAFDIYDRQMLKQIMRMAWQRFQGG